MPSSTNRPGPLTSFCPGAVACTNLRRCCSSRTRWGRTNQGLPHNLLRLKLNFACSASPLSPTCRKLPDPLLHHKVADLRHLHGAVEPTAASPTFESCRSTALAEASPGRPPIKKRGGAKDL